MLQRRFSMVVMLVVAAVVGASLTGRARLPRVAIPIPPATELRIVRAVCHERKVTVTPVPRFARVGRAKTDIRRACIRDWNDTLHALRTRANVPVDPAEP